MNASAPLPLLAAGSSLRVLPLQISANLMRDGWERWRLCAVRSGTDKRAERLNRLCVCRPRLVAVTTALLSVLHAAWDS